MSLFTKTNRVATAALMAAFLFGGTSACSSGTSGTANVPKGSAGPGGNTGPVDKDGNAVSKAAENKFNSGLELMQKHDLAGDWNAGVCTSVAATFNDANSEQDGKLTEAKYNAAVAHQRCHDNDKALGIFKEILDENSEFHRARVQVALYNYQKDKNIENAIGEMERAIKDAQFKNEEALVNLAMLQMERDGSSGGSGCSDDFDCAKLNLQRALAVNDSFMPAFNQLAVFYLESAKKKAGRKRGKSGVAAARTQVKKANQQALELAALVISQALRKNPNYAPVHNTSGLISSEMGDLSAAAQSFGRARKLDTNFYEAHMNYAAVNLQFRGFDRAEEAYRAALKQHPNDFEAHLGLALAVRGQINDSNYDAKLKGAQASLDKAKKADPSRPEVYFNEAILTQEFRARDGAKSEPMLLKAKGLYQQFIDKAGSKDEYADGVKGAKERMEEIDTIIAFAKMNAKTKAIEEANRKREEAEKLKNKDKDKK